MGCPCLNKWKIMTNYTNFLLHTPRSPFTTCWFDATLLNPQQTFITNTPKFLQKICYNTWKQQNVYAIGSNSKGHNKVQHQSIINQMHHKMNILQLNTRIQVHQKLKTAYAKMQKCISQYQKHDHKLYTQWWYQEGWDFHTSRLLNNRVIKASLKATTRFVLNLKVTSLKAIKVIHWSFFSLMTICWQFWS
jgi:hypothetical protein